MVHVCLIIVSDACFVMLVLAFIFPFIFSIDTMLAIFSLYYDRQFTFLNGIFIFDNSIWSISFINLRICTYVLLIYLLVCSDGDFH